MFDSQPMRRNSTKLTIASVQACDEGGGQGYTTERGIGGTLNSALEILYTMHSIASKLFVLPTFVHVHMSHPNA